MSQTSWNQRGLEKNPSYDNKVKPCKGVSCKSPSFKMVFVLWWVGPVKMNKITPIFNFILLYSLLFGYGVLGRISDKRRCADNSCSRKLITRNTLVLDVVFLAY